MALYQVTHVTRTARSLMMAVIVLSVVACVPSIQRIYHTPAVTGQVIDLNTLKPIMGAVVQHHDSGIKFDPDTITSADKDRVVTNQAGEYSLPSTSSVEAILLMAGHAIHDYPVRISTKNNSALVIVKASLRMLSEEFSYANVLILDQDPKTIAATPPGNYLSYNELHSYLKPQAKLGHCDPGIGKDALTSLNTARKIYWRHAKASDIDQKILNLAYNNVNNVWRYFYNSCDFGESGTLSRRQAVYSVREITDRINQEASAMVSQ